MWVCRTVKVSLNKRLNPGHGSELECPFSRTVPVFCLSGRDSGMIPILSAIWLLPWWYRPHLVQSYQSIACPYNSNFVFNYKDLLKYFYSKTEI